ncbi:RHS repeat protein [Escherichia coli]|nr:RHS repeat protein [Escherichia coli]
MRRDGGRSTGCIWRRESWTSVILPDGRTVRYGYNNQLQLTSVTYPDGLRRSRKYDRQAGWRKRSRATVTLRAGFMILPAVACPVRWKTEPGEAENNAKPVRSASGIYGLFRVHDAV